MTTFLYKTISHHYQRRIISFQVGGKQTNDTPFCRITIKQTKGFIKAFLVQAGISYKMFTVDALRGTTTFENNFGFKQSSGYPVRFKKPDG